MPTHPKITVEPVSPGHLSPDLSYVVVATVPGGLGAGMASCRSVHRAEIVADALRLLAASDPSFAERVSQASLADRRESAET